MRRQRTPYLDPRLHHPPAPPRVMMACQNCHRRKHRCDGKKPSCGLCSRNSVPCVYSKHNKRMYDPRSEAIISAIEDVTQSLERGFQSIGRVLDMRKASPDQLAAGSSLNVIDLTSESDQRFQNENILDGLSIPVKHTTAAHNLLCWPFIRELLSPEKYDEDYVLQLEEKRGLVDSTNESPAISLRGILKTGAKEAHRYYKRYLTDIHCFHPFLEVTKLDAMVQKFIDCHCPRKSSSRPPIELTTQNAIVLLVMAIGVSCERIELLKASGISPTPSHMIEDTTSMDRKEISGVSLYGYASHILGVLTGQTCLAYVQAALLAGIYAAQLPHPLQSHAWIFQACRVCQILLREPRYIAMRPFEQDLCDSAFWTCFQLESELLAELELPASGLSRLESTAKMPNGRFNFDESSHTSSTEIMLFYLAQGHLRKILNRTYTELYKPKQFQRTQGRSTLPAALACNLQLWRAHLPAVMQWDDGAPPATDLRTAYLRASFYTAQYIIHRPDLCWALEYLRASPIDSNTDKEPLSEQVKRDTSQELRESCKVCIDSAISSIRALDRVKAPLIVPNLFGTAHGQYGSVLVLSAVYMSSLRDLVDANVLQYLFQRTINFLQQYGGYSPSLRADAMILTKVYCRIFAKYP